MRVARTVGRSVDRTMILGQRGAFGEGLSTSAYCPSPGGRDLDYFSAEKWQRFCGGHSTVGRKGRAALHAREKRKQNTQAVLNAGYIATEAAQALYDLATGGGAYE